MLLVNSCGVGAALAAAPAAGDPFIQVDSEDNFAPRYFPLRDVRLGPGPFLDAQKLDESYLLALEPDRMLHNFRVNAGLKPKAAVYGGWESVEPWIWIRCHGHTLGHYLTAASCMHESTGDARFADRVDYIVAELAECQSKTAGWLSAFPDGIEPLTHSLSGKEFPGVPWYTVHKVLAGLRDAHVHRGSKQAFDIWLTFTDWIDAVTREVPVADFQKMLDREHGGMNEVCADLFAITRKPAHLALAQRFCHMALLEPLARGEDALDGLHANTQIPKVVGFDRIDQLSEAPRFRSAADFFWNTVVKQRSYATGGHGDLEHFFPKGEFAKRLDSAKTMETCCTHNMMRLTRALYGRNAAVAYIDYYERALLNGILASQDPESGMNSYFQSTRPGYVRLYHTPFDSFWCCTGSGMENHARYGETIFAHDRNNLIVNLFISATLDWRETGFTVTQETRFPDADTTRLVFKGRKTQKLKVRLRQPSWCEVMTVSVNGRRVATARQPGSYHLLERKFGSGDAIEVHMPMTLRLEPLPNAPDFAALLYGPIVLAGRLGAAGLTQGSQIIVNERESGKMLNEKVEIPRWDRPLAELIPNTARTDPQTLHFTTRGFAGGKEVELLPWFRMTHERYNLYWGKTPA
ncbi:MAG: beta-L-arabinofuranosidase domain-containing protein [bacterium]